MKVLNLRSDVLKNPTRLDLEIIGAAMLFPDDENKRIRCEEAAGALLAIDALGKDADAVPLFVRFAAEEIRNEAIARYRKGMICSAFTLHELIGRESLGLGAPTIRSIFDNLSKKDALANGTFSKKSFDANWAMFRPVAHFWVSHFYFGPEFPCNLSDLRQFLELAESFRIAGENTRTFRSPVLVLDPADTVKLPPELKIEAEDLGFEPCAPWP